MNLVAIKLIADLGRKNLFPSSQAGFRKGHFIETLLVLLLSDIGSIDRTPF